MGIPLYYNSSMKSRILLICLAGSLLCACNSRPEPAPQRPRLQVKRMPDLPAHASRRKSQIQNAALECSRIQVSCGEKARELSPDAVAEMKKILTRVQAIPQWGGLCATPGATIRIAFLDTTGNEFTSLTDWEIGDAASPAGPYHCTLSLPSEDYRHFRELLRQSLE